MTELTVHQQTSTDLTQQMDYARAVSAAGILPKAYQGNPGSVLIAMGLGSAMGLSPAESLYRIHVIEGKPSASAELIAANVRRAGHKLRVRGDATSATVQIVRADDPDYPFEVTWRIEDAQRAGLAGKGVWKAYPAAMLKARAITECARTACPEALYGVQYTDEEIRDLPPEVEARPRRESAAALLTQAAPEAEAHEPQTVESSEPSATSRQLTAIRAGLGERGVKDRGEVLAIVAEMVGRDISSSKELTRAEAGLVLDTLANPVDDAAYGAGSPDGNADS